MPFPQICGDCHLQLEVDYLPLLKMMISPADSIARLRLAGEIFIFETEVDSSLQVAGGASSSLPSLQVLEDH